MNSQNISAKTAFLYKHLCIIKKKGRYTGLYFVFFLVNVCVKSYLCMMAGLYIHIPFCQRRCSYCGFFSTTALECREAYVDALCHEMRLRGDATIRTIYLGGGTPSLLKPSMLRQLFTNINEVFAVDPEAEVTMECNPDDVTDEYARVLCEVGVNRVSMGIQTFSDDRLRFLNRRHDSRQAMEAFGRLRHAGFTNISVDLMFGFPGETLADWHDDIDRVLALGMEHLSAYSLMYEEGTPLYRLLEKGEVDEVDDETYLSMYEMLVEALSKAGYEHYEISNFALPGFRSRHNSSYWDGTPYIGIGAGAHSYDGDVRQSNVTDLERYMEAVSKDSLPCEVEVLTLTDHYNDMVTTALRTKEGICLSDVERKFGRAFLDDMMENSQPHLDAQRLVVERGFLHLTLKGIALSDMVMSDLVRV